MTLFESMAARIASRVAIDFHTQKEMDNYLREHPGADKSNHKVVNIEVVDHHHDHSNVVDHRHDPKKKPEIIDHRNDPKAPENPGKKDKIEVVDHHHDHSNVVDHRHDPKKKPEIIDHRNDPKAPENPGKKDKVPEPGISDGKKDKAPEAAIHKVDPKLVPDPKLSDWAAESGGEATAQVLKDVQSGKGTSASNVEKGLKEIKDAIDKDPSSDNLKRLRESEKTLRGIADFLEALMGEGGRYRDDDEPRYRDFDGDYISDEAQNLIGAHKISPKSVKVLQDFVQKRDTMVKKEKAIELDFPKAKKKYEEDKAAWDKAVKSYEKKHPPKSKPPKPKGDSTPEYDKALKEYEADQEARDNDLPEEPRPPREPRKPKSTAEVMKDYIDALDDPEEKDRIRKMEPEDFEKLMGAIRGSGKVQKLGSLRTNMIRLAYTTAPSLRSYLVALLHGTE